MFLSAVGSLHEGDEGPVPTFGHAVGLGVKSSCEGFGDIEKSAELV